MGQPSLYNIAKYDQNKYLSDEQSMHLSDSLVNEKFQDSWYKTKGNDNLDTTDFGIVPLMPTIKRNIDNKLAKHLEKDDYVFPTPLPFANIARYNLAKYDVDKYV